MFFHQKYKSGEQSLFNLSSVGEIALEGKEILMWIPGNNRDTTH